MASTDRHTKEGGNDGTTTCPTTSNKRQQTHDSTGFEFSCSSSPLAKRAVVRTSPERMKQHVTYTATMWFLDKLGNTNSNQKGLTAQQRKFNQLFTGLRAPSGPALEHPAAPLLLELATVGCTVANSDEWTIEALEATIDTGAHPSALVPEAAQQLRDKTLEKVAQGFARLVAWANVKDRPPKTLKISPIAAIPHKSRGFRMILDLSWGITVGTNVQKSVNDGTHPDVAPAQSMAELGNGLPRLIYAVATAPVSETA